MDEYSPTGTFIINVSRVEECKNDKVSNTALIGISKTVDMTTECVQYYCENMGIKYPEDQMKRFNDDIIEFLDTNNNKGAYLAYNILLDHETVEENNIVTTCGWSILISYIGDGCEEIAKKDGCCFITTNFSTMFDIKEEIK